MLPFLTAELPAAGGVLKRAPEDFVVEELPTYEPCGEGEHLFVWVEKRGWSTPQAAKQLARALGASEKDVSWAGLKDRDAVTRQYLCLPARKASDPAAATLPAGLKLLRWARHRNKLKSGHLRGNRFELVLRDVAAPDVALEAFGRVLRLGAPNYFGEQRFGVQGDNAARGKAILQAGGRHADRFERKLFLSAFQSELFNQVLAQRLADGLFSTVLAGDVLKKLESGGEFVCEAPDVDQPRADAFELGPTGPLFGPDMRAPAGAVAAREQRVLEAEGIDAALFERGGGETQGARRLLRMPVRDGAAAREGDAVRLGFTLPAGSYATVVVRELTKAE